MSEIELAELRSGDILVKKSTGRRYEYRGERKLGPAPGFLLCELNNTFLEGTAARWTPDWCLDSFELMPRPEPRRRVVAPVSVVDVHLPDGEAAA